MQYSLHIKFTTVLPVLLEPAAHELCSRGREEQRYGEGEGGYPVELLFLVQMELLLAVKSCGTPAFAFLSLRLKVQGSTPSSLPSSIPPPLHVCVCV